MKKRFLAVGEFSGLHTGYSRYYHEVLSRLNATNKFEIAEMASYVSPDNPLIYNVPWKVYPVQPSRNADKRIIDHFNSDLFNQFGKAIFEEVVLDFKPDVVGIVRDTWMDSFVFDSPLRQYYKLCWLNPVDGTPQASDWIDKTLNCDNVFTYTDWGRDVLNHQCGRNVCQFSAPPAADPIFNPISERRELRKKCGLGNAKLIGMVARNQGRKCFPELFDLFKRLREHSNHDIKLYLHTSYPDAGFDIPRLLIENEISSHVLFTYKCRACNRIFPSYFSDALNCCHYCGKPAAGLTNVKDGCNNEELKFIYNLFDLYVQWSTAGGFEMPIAEAAACGVPVVGVDYSGMSDVIRKVGGIPIAPQGFRVDVDSGRYFAIPDNDLLLKVIQGFFDLPEAEQDKFGRRVRSFFERSYNWDMTTSRWERYLDSVEVSDVRSRWQQPPQIHQIPSTIPSGLTNSQFARWLIMCVLNEPEKCGTYMESRIIRDLNYGVTTGGLSGKYHSEFSAMFGKPYYDEFNQEQAFRHFVHLAENKNRWEARRGELQR